MSLRVANPTEGSQTQPGVMLALQPMERRADHEVVGSQSWSVASVWIVGSQSSSVALLAVNHGI